MNNNSNGNGPEHSKPEHPSTPEVGVSEQPRYSADALCADSVAPSETPAHAVAADASSIIGDARTPRFGHGISFVSLLAKQDGSPGDAKSENLAGVPTRSEPAEAENVACSQTLPERAVDDSLDSTAATLVCSEAPDSSHQSIMEKYGLSSLPYADLSQLVEEASRAALECRQAEFKALLESCLKKADELGFSDAVVVSRLKSLSSNRDLQRGLNQRGTRTGGNADKTGQKPRVGVTYRHPVTGRTWTKSRPQGAAPSDFLDQVNGGNLTWADLEAPSRATEQA